MLEQITPVILTFNEEDNIGRTLARLEWARDIVIVDSFSSDSTLELARAYDNLRVFQRAFDTHANQWSYALKETEIKTPWVLALDADYRLSDSLIEEIRTLKPEEGVAGYEAEFRYCVYGHVLRGSLYPPVTALYRTDRAHYVQDGHTQRVVVAGDTARLAGVIFHDDRKPLSHWLAAQDRYMRLEANHLATTAWRDLGWSDRVRKLVFLAPVVIPWYCLFVKRGILDGKPGLFYALQRMTAESMLSLRLLKASFDRL